MHYCVKMKNVTLMDMVHSFGHTILMYLTLKVGCQTWPWWWWPLLGLDDEDSPESLFCHHGKHIQSPDSDDVATYVPRSTITKESILHSLQCKTNHLLDIYIQHLLTAQEKKTGNGGGGWFNWDRPWSHKLTINRCPSWLVGRVCQDKFERAEDW